MTTQLTKPIAREFLHRGARYKAVISADGIRVTPKGGRRAVMLSWESVLSLEHERPAIGRDTDGQAAGESGPGEKPQLGMQEVIAADVLLLIREVTERLAQASALIDRASELPSVLAEHREPPPPSDEQRSDWYIEPLLTIRQVSQLLGVSSRRVRGIALKAVILDGEVRYQPAELRRFLAAQAQPALQFPRR
jgi:hypothetical protein